MVDCRYYVTDQAFWGVRLIYGSETWLWDLADLRHLK